MTSSLRILPVSLALSAALASSGCVSIESPPGVMFASQPSGARIIVDGVDSGFVTPCHLDLGHQTHEIDLVLEGYKPASVHIDEGGDTWLVLWDEAWISAQSWRFPLWLNARDGLFPIKVERSSEPERVYVRLGLVESQDRPRRSAGGR